MSNELVSIIIPVYNGEKYLSACLDSIFQQSFQDYKVYIINDGSTDRTSEILETYTEHPKVSIINQDNAGVSAARNKGLELVVGEYVVFLDADDIVLPGFFETLLAPFENEQILLTTSSYKTTDIETGQVRILQFEPRTLSQDEAGEYMLSEQGPQGYLWNKMFRLTKIRELGLQFHPDIFMAEDLLFVMEYLQSKGKTAVLNTPVYNYMIYSGSSNKTRLSNLSEGYETYFDNFFLCMDKIAEIVTEENSRSYQASLGRKGRMAINYLRANRLAGNNDKQLKARLTEMAWKFRKFYFSGIDATLKSRLIYLLTLIYPSFVLMRDKKHFQR